MSAKKFDKFKKWLPAISLAVVIHLILIAVVMNSQKQTVITADDSLVSTPTTNVEAALINDDELLNDTEVLTTLSDTTIIEKTTQSTDKAGDQAQNKQADQDTGSAQSGASQGNSASNIDKASSNTNTDSTSPALQAKANKTSQIDSANTNTNTTYSSASSEPPYLEKNTSSASDQLLLSRDLPQAEAHGLAEEKGFKSTAQEVEALNDKLGRMVDEVKEQKLKEIDAQQQASKAAYLRARNIQLSSTEQNPAATKDDRGDE
ncbi:hypothetical protein [Psychrobacter sanguinis]|uniref:Uncharacterized protein n=1 Tax=Psychrobacter sanguinis TaxID=861445 RepID=A0A844M030_9GAMM|nr:hypothetical protein [Psychrobacter sanguinis]MUG32282.1 hypothetical protein [Psychrobacter sanguinis]